MKHLLRVFFALAIIFILYIFLKKNKLIEGIGGHGGGVGGHGMGGHGMGAHGMGAHGIGGHRGYEGGGYGGYKGLLTGALASYDDYDTLFYQPTDLCFDTLGNIIPCITPTLIRPSFFY